MIKMSARVVLNIEYRIYYSTIMSFCSILASSSAHFSESGFKQVVIYTSFV